MKLGETIVRLLGGGALGAIIGLILSAAPLALARILMTFLGIVLIVLIGFFVFGLEQKGRFAVVGLVVVLVILLLLDQTIAAALWRGVRFLADALARALLATRGKTTGETVLIWAVLGAVVSWLSGSVNPDAWRRVNR
ncbi:MAG: hypothetical protein KC418_00440 [Anaerolineales bacterium]|nr:hypothetical protein [Anaerolineales bacterium]MCB8952630.1 hypothetical protein [Ardenticatenales bacterium]